MVFFPAGNVVDQPLRILVRHTVWVTRHGRESRIASPRWMVMKENTGRENDTLGLTLEWDTISDHDTQKEATAAAQELMKTIKYPTALIVENRLWGSPHPLRVAASRALSVARKRFTKARLSR